jgi:hypothetical protein
MIATMVVVQFETAEAIARADEIFSVGGVDMALTGANHLMADLGIPSQYEHEKVCDAYATAIAAAQRSATPRQACRRRWFVEPTRTCRGLRQYGSTLHLDWHRSRFPAWRCN